MSNFVNLLDIIYPVGSIYFSVSEVSPADAVGGTWEQIKDTVLAASGDSYAGPADSYDGEKYILYRQMPFHTHEIRIADVNATVHNYYGNAISRNGYAWTNNFAGNSEVARLREQLRQDILSKGNGVNEQNYRLLDNKFFGITNHSLTASACIAAGGGRTTFHTIIQSMYGNVLPKLFEGVGL